MHSVQRSPAPEFFAELRASYTDWDDLGGGDRQRIRDALIQDFRLICAYCKQFCQLTQPRVQTECEETTPQPDEESVDHFRPRRIFPDLWLDWLNLIYACYRCNQSKADSWPVEGDMKNRLLTAAHRPRYTPVSEYVNPNATDGQRPAQEFFDFDLDTGEIRPVDHLNDAEWSMARRTIYDIDLNDELSGRDPYDPEHLSNKRRYHLYLFIEQVNSYPDLSYQIMQEATLPEKPFSTFVSAYLSSDSLGLV